MPTIRNPLNEAFPMAKKNTSATASSIGLEEQNEIPKLHSAAAQQGDLSANGNTGAIQTPEKKSPVDVDQQDAKPKTSNATPENQKPVAENSQRPVVDARSPSSPGARIRGTKETDIIAMQTIANIKVHVQAILGGIQMSVSQLANLQQGEVISLDSRIGEVIDIIANGQLIARGEIVVIEEGVPRFGITLTEIA